MTCSHVLSLRALRSAKKRERIPTLPAMRLPQKPRALFFARLRFHPPCICSRGLNLCAKGAREFCFSYAQKILSLPSLNCGDCCGITFASDSAARNPSGAAARLTGERPQQIEAIFCSAFSPQSAKNFARFTFLRVLRSFSSLCEEVFAPSNSAGVAAALEVL